MQIKKVVIVDLAPHQKTTAGEAIRAAVVRIAEYPGCAMVEQDSGLAEFDAADKQRREKTKSAIDLD